MLYRFARHFIKKIKKNDINKVKYTCFVADDSDLEKRTPLLSTKISLNFTEVYDIYSNRWAIEIFFKESKQNFGLEKNQSQDFDSQIASTTISFIQYLMLSLYKRYEKYETIGGAFLESKNQMQEIVLSGKIQFLLIKVVEILVIELDLDIEIEKIISKVISNIDIKSKIEDFLPPKAA